MKFARANSLLWRIIWLHMVALALAAVAVPLACYMLLSSTANSYENQTLEAHAATIGRYLKHDAGGGWQLALPADLKTFYAREFDGFAFSIVDADGRVIESSRQSRAPISGEPQSRSAPVFFQKREGKAVYYGASIPKDIAGRRVWIEIAQDLDHPDVILDNVVADFLPRVLWLSIPIMLIVLAADIFVVRLALAPVRLASDEASAIDPGRLDLRLPSAGLPAEITPLVAAFNQVLDRLETGFRVQREFTADAAHELRTPLSVLRARAETLDQTSARQLQHDIDVMARIVDQLLAVADLEGRTIDLGEILDLRRVCTRVADHLSPVAEAAGKRIFVSAPKEPVLVRGDAELLFHALRNLAENAIRHTPAQSAVQIIVEENSTVLVIDEGSGVGEGERDLIFRRFWRRDRSHSGGAGLGLPIAARIITAHGGRIQVDDRQPTGAVFSVKLERVMAVSAQD